MSSPSAPVNHQVTNEPQHPPTRLRRRGYEARHGTADGIGENTTATVANSLRVSAAA